MDAQTNFFEVFCNLLSAEFIGNLLWKLLMSWIILAFGKSIYGAVSEHIILPKIKNYLHRRSPNQWSPAILDIKFKDLRQQSKEQTKTIALALHLCCHLYCGLPLWPYFVGTVTIGVCVFWAEELRMGVAIGEA
ncbi:hypothetical protein LTR85_000616 [Meristemomyces frigidus]|nr:hypothetical protein LTR85_000616 [Meristemomyces frigidus]